MSLIAEALRAAQRERENPQTRKEDVARSILAGSAQHPGDDLWLRHPRPHLPRSLGIALALFITAVLGAAGFVSWSIRPGGTTSEAETVVGQLTRRSPVVAASKTTAEMMDSLTRHSRPAAPRLRPASVDAPAAPRPSRTVPTTGAPSRQVPTGGGQPPSAAPVSRETTPPSFQLVLAPPRQEAGDLFRQGVAAQAHRDFASAAEYYRASLGLDPENAEASNNLGIVYQALGQLTAARDAFRQAVSLQPRFAAAWSNLGGVLSTLGQNQEAQAALAEAIRRDPGSAGARVNLALLYQKQGRTAEGERLLREALAVDSSTPEAHYALAQILEQQGHLSEAVEHYRLFLSTAAGRFPRHDTAVRERLRHLVGSPDGGE